MKSIGECHKGFVFLRHVCVRVWRWQFRQEQFNGMLRSRMKLLPHMTSRYANHHVLEWKDRVAGPHGP